MQTDSRSKGSLRLVLTAIGVSLAGCGHQYERWAPIVAKADETVFKRILAKAPHEHRVLLEREGLRLPTGIRDESTRELRAEVARNWASEDLGPGTLYRTLRVSGVPQRSVDPTSEASPVVREAAEENACKLRVMYAEEHAAIREARPNAAPYIGLALSGGGIRSAGFAAGVMKGLHEIGLLDQVGYVSSISGGGYAGAWYMYHGYEWPLAEDPDPITNPTIDRADELFRPGSPHLQHITQNGDFLSAGNFRGSGVELLKNMGIHLINTPSVWIFNWLFDTQVNWTSHYREVYRAGVANSFLYGHPGGRSQLSLFSNYMQQIASQGPPLTRPLARLYGVLYGLPMTFVKALRAPFHMVQRLLGFDVIRFSAADVSFHRTINATKPSEIIPRPLWIAGAQISLIDDDQVATKARSGEYFEITPIRCGADSVGYVQTPEFKGSDAFWMMPDHVCAISGAALDSAGLDIGLVASVLSRSMGFDLGYYVNAWGAGWVEDDWGFTLFCNSIHYWITAFGPIRWLHQTISPSPHDLHRNAKNFLLTDGGHFDNTGLYGLVRRGCRLIIVADATAEAKVNHWDRLSPKERAALFEDFRNTELKLQADHGVEFEMDWENFSPGSRDNEGRPDKLLINGRIRNLPVYCEFPTPGGATRRKFSHYVQILYLRSAYDLSQSARKGQSYIDRQQALKPDYPNLSTFDINYSESEMAGMIQIGTDAVTSHEREFHDAFQRIFDLEAAATSPPKQP